MSFGLEHRMLSTVMRCFWEDAGASGPLRLRGVHSDVCMLAAREATPAAGVVQLTGGEGHLHESSCFGLGSSHDGAAILRITAQHWHAIARAEVPKC
jgi:hypothetical protein